MMRIIFIGVLMASVLGACTISASTPRPTDVPAYISTTTPIPFTSTPEFHSTITPIPEQLHGMEYSSVAEALADLKTRNGVSIKMMQGWTIIMEADGLTNWSFVPTDHPAYPAVAKRVLFRDQDGWHLKMDVLCEAERAACDEFVRYFEVLNEPIYRMIEQQEP